MKHTSTKATIIYIGIVVLLSAFRANASTYFANGKEITKGEAIKLLVNDPKAVVVKQDQVVFNDEKGTLKNKSK